jgi:hypothetical protein
MSALGPFSTDRRRLRDVHCPSDRYRFAALRQGTKGANSRRAILIRGPERAPFATQWNSVGFVWFSEHRIFNLEANVSTRMQIVALIYMMVQAVTFGIGIIIVLATPLQAEAMKMIPVVVVASSLVSIPASWLLAPRLQARYWRAKGVNSDFISGPAEPS